MTYDEAIATIAGKLDSIDGLPNVSDATLNPDSAPTPSIYLYDEEEILESADLQRSDITASTARAIIMLKTGKTGNRNAAKECRQRVETIVTAIQALSATQPDFTVFVSRVRYAYDLAHSTWAVAFLSLTVEAYRR